MVIQQREMYQKSVDYSTRNEEKLPVHFEVGDLVRFKERRRKMDKSTYWLDHVYMIIKKNRFSYMLGNPDESYNLISQDIDLSTMRCN